VPDLPSSTVRTGRVLVFQHLDCEHPGIFRNFLARDGITLDVIELDAGELPPEDFTPWDALLVCGGPMDVWEEDRLPWLAIEKQAIRRWLATGRPYLGLCLGHQLLAEAAGGAVGLMPIPDVGLRAPRPTPGAADDAIFRALPAEITCVQWHGAMVTRLPPNAVVLATSDITPVEAMRVGANAWGVQFHIEVTAQMVADWTDIPEYDAALRRSLGADGAAAFLAATNATLPRMADIAERLYVGLRDRMGRVSAGS